MTLFLLIFLCLLDWPRSGSEHFEPGSNPNPNLMFEVQFSQIIEPEPKRRFGFGVSANLNIRLRTEPFFQGENLELEDFFAYVVVSYMHMCIFLLKYY